MPTETDQILRSEILNLLQYLQRLREEIGCIVQQPNGQTRFRKMSDQLDDILTSTGEATHLVLEDLEAILLLVQDESQEFATESVCKAFAGDSSRRTHILTSD